ncbi:MAG: sulfatase-like hydrolase/transferase [Pirellulales bacterium]
MQHTPGFRRWSYVGACLVLLSTIAVAGLAWYRWQSAAGPPRWNVVLITLDTTRPDHLGCYGYLPAHTPAIDRWAHNGVRYQRCYSPAPMTLPAHCSLMTGLDPPRHAVHTNRQVLSSDVETLPEFLSKHGYATAAVVGAFVLDRRFGLAQGCNTYNDDMSQGHDPGRFSYIERNAESVTDAALAWWGKPHDQPKFLWVHYFDPHSPYAPPDYDPAFSPFKPYDAEIAFVNRHLERLLSAVNAASQDTLVVLTADHGEGLGEHGEQTHGLFAYDSTLRVPLIVQFPDRRGAGKLVAEPVSLVDVMPSVLNWLGFPVPEDLDGRPLPLPDELTTVSAKEPRAIYFENEYVARSYGWSPLRGIIAGNWKLIEAPRPELYDLANDPRELDNRFDPNDPHLRKLSEELANVLARQSQFQAASAAATELDELSLRKLRSLGYVAESTTRADDAEASRQNRAPDPKDMVGIYDQIHLAMAHVTEGQVAEGVALLAAIIDDPQHQPPSARAVRTLAALVVEDRAARPDGIPCLQRMIERQEWRTVDQSVYESLGVALIDEGRQAEAVRHLRRLVTLQPDHAAAHYLLGGAYREVGDNGLAAESFQRAIQFTDQRDERPKWLEDAKLQLDRIGRQQREAKAAEKFLDEPKTPG